LLFGKPIGIVTSVAISIKRLALFVAALSCSIAGIKILLTDHLGQCGLRF